jgi:hypothetical protein
MTAASQALTVHHYNILLINAEQIFAVGRVIKQTASQWG